MTLHLAWGDEIAFPGPYYLQIDGKALPVGTVDSGIGKYPEADANDAARAALYDEIGSVDVYFHHQQLRAGREDGEHDDYYEAVLLRFVDEEAAEEYVASFPERFADDGVEDPDQLDEAPTAGDDAVAFTYRRDFGDELTHFHHPTYVRVGDIVARIEVIGVAQVGEGAAAVAETQTRCLADGGCPEPLEASAVLRAG